MEILLEIKIDQISLPSETIGVIIVSDIEAINLPNRFMVKYGGS